MYEHKTTFSSVFFIFFTFGILINKCLKEKLLSSVKSFVVKRKDSSGYLKLLQLAFRYNICHVTSQTTKLDFQAA